MQGGGDVIVEVRNRCSDFNSYRAARVKSLFNAESGADFDLTAELPIEDDGWALGVIVGPSGSGKTSLGRQLWGEEALASFDDWPADRPIIDAIAPGGDFDAVTGALAGVGLGSVPTWLRPYPVLSNGEKFRANLARVLCEAPERIVIDEFSSVVDRQIAKFGALAFGKSWRRVAGGSRRCVLLSCHYDIIDWLEPDWVFDTATGRYAGRGLWRRPKFELEIRQVDGRWWRLFEPHHYLKLPQPVAATYFLGTVEGEPVAHVAFAPALEVKGMRATRLVIMPEWQGAGVGTRFLNALCQWHVEGKSRYGARVRTVYFHTTHPGLCAALRRDRRWAQVSAKLYGVNKKKSEISMQRSGVVPAGYGGHFRAVQGFRYLGEGGGG